MQLAEFPLRKMIPLAMVLLVALPFFFLGGPDWLSTPLFRAVWNLGHIAFFGVLLILIQLRWPLPHAWQWLCVAVCVLFIGGAVEVAQAFIGREGSWNDIFRNLLGAGLGLFWGQQANARIWFARTIMSAALLLPAWSVSQVAYLQYDSVKRFPMLAGFESERELQRWGGRVARVQRHASAGEYALKIHFSTRQFSGVKFGWYLGDWTPFKQLEFDVYNPDDEPLALTLRINDIEHDKQGSHYDDRFNSRLLVQPGWNNIVVPLAQVKAAPAAREMRLDQINELGFFTQQLPQERTLYLDNLRLE